MRNLIPSGGGGTLSSSKGFQPAYTLAEIVIVMLIISVVVAVTIGVTKKKLDSTISYSYYSAYESLKDVSRALLTDFNPQNENYKALNLVEHLAQASGHSSYFALLDSLWDESAWAYENGLIDAPTNNSGGVTGTGGVYCPGLQCP